MDGIEVIFVLIAIAGMISSIRKKASEKNRKEQEKDRGRANQQPGEQPQQTGRRSEARQYIDDAWKQALDRRSSDTAVPRQVPPIVESAPVSPEEKQRRFEQGRAMRQQRMQETNSDNSDEQSFRGSLQNDADRQSFRGSLSGFSGEGYCPPEHDHNEQSALTEFEQRRTPGNARINAQSARQGVVWAEILKRPKMGVAPRNR